MPNTVRDWMSSPVVVVDPDSSVKYALTLMRRRKIHSVVVAMSEKIPSMVLSLPPIYAIRSWLPGATRLR